MGKITKGELLTKAQEAEARYILATKSQLYLQMGQWTALAGAVAMFAGTVLSSVLGLLLPEDLDWAIILIVLLYGVLVGRCLIALIDGLAARALVKELQALTPTLGAQATPRRSRARETARHIKEVSGILHKEK